MDRAVIAVAGSRKTQSIVDECAYARSERRTLVVTYTLTGQAELSSRLRKICEPGKAPIVTGWFGFLLKYWVRPYLPLFFPGRRLRGFNFDGDPGLYASGVRRYLDSDGKAYMIHLSKLAMEVAEASQGAVLQRLQRIFSKIYIDEVQDLTGCDLHILSMIMDSTIDLYTVGDIRQSVYETNYRDRNLTQYKSVKKLDWFKAMEDGGKLSVEFNSTTWRSNQEIATFSDSIFQPKFDFPPTVSEQDNSVEHGGVFALSPSDVEVYLSLYDPLCLRASRATARNIDLQFRTFGKVKGLTVDRVLIYPTGVVREYLYAGGELADKTACGLYVAVTRAKYSVAFVVDRPERTSLRVWPNPT